MQEVHAPESPSDVSDECDDECDDADYTLQQYNKERKAAWRYLGLWSGTGAQPGLLAQLQALPRGYAPWQRSGRVCWEHVAADMGITMRPVRLAAGAPTVKRDTVEVMTIIVPKELRRNKETGHGGVATRFFEELQRCAAAMHRVVLVESVLSEPLYLLLMKLGAVNQNPLFDPDAGFDEGQNFVLPPTGTGAGAGAGAGTGVPTE